MSRSCSKNVLVKISGRVLARFLGSSTRKAAVCLLAAAGRSAKQCELIRVRGFGNPAMGAGINAIFKTWIALAKQRQRFGPGAGKAQLLPNLVEAARVAGVPLDEVLLAHAQPARDPDIDRIVLGEGPAKGRCGRRGVEKRSDHGKLHAKPAIKLCCGLDATDKARLIAFEQSNLKAASRAATRKSCPVILFPAIDLKDGKCVRLKLGEMDQATVFNDDPAAQAAIFERQGFKYLHIVDLNGAFAGKPVNATAVEAILKAIRMPAQLGGGIRDLATAEMWLTKGIARVILGTVAVRDPALVKAACKAFPGRVAVGIDAKGGKVAVEGWAETSELTAIDLARQFEDAGVSAIIYTDIERDGVLKGLNLPATAELARATSIPVIASGGLASIDDVRALLRPEYAMLEGAISGRALYDGRIDPAQALALLAR